MAKHALVVENLGKHFPPALTGWRALLQPFSKLTFCARTGVSLSAAPGEVLALIGANRTGKSTLLRILPLCWTLHRTKITGILTHF